MRGRLSVIPDACVMTSTKARVGNFQNRSRDGCLHTYARQSAIWMRKRTAIFYSADIVLVPGVGRRPVVDFSVLVIISSFEIMHFKPTTESYYVWKTDFFTLYHNTFLPRIYSKCTQRSRCSHVTRTHPPLVSTNRPLFEYYYSCSVIMWWTI